MQNPNSFSKKFAYLLLMQTALHKTSIAIHHATKGADVFPYYNIDLTQLC